MSRVGPRTVGIAAGICYGLGVALASLSAGRLSVVLPHALAAGVRDTLAGSMTNQLFHPNFFP